MSAVTDTDTEDSKIQLRFIPVDTREDKQFQSGRSTTVLKEKNTLKSKPYEV